MSLVLFGVGGSVTAFGKELQSNAIRFHNAPAWLTERRLEKLTDRIQNVLEWDVRRIEATWHTDQREFETLHGFGPAVLAFARRADHSVHVGPRVDSSNFDETFGHELIHVILFQKYKDAIPRWLEEGLANYAAKAAKVDYAWLAKRAPFPDVRLMIHPFKAISAPEGKGAEGWRFHYVASQALIEMIASKCRLHELLQLSVGKKLETYLQTYCRIQDINVEFGKWVSKKAKVQPSALLRSP